MTALNDEEMEELRSSLKEQLIKGVVEVTFTKVDGEVRTMPCTLDPTLIPLAPINETVGERKKKKENLSVMSVWCVDKSAWRSFRLDSFIGAVGVPHGE